MAERRMFAKTIIDSDAFLDMPATSQLLYFHLSMRADDDGFINKPKSIMRMIGACEDDIKLLFVKKFLIPFESGVVVIKHWKIHNYIRKDTYRETKYKAEKSTLELDENEAYRIACDDVVTGTLQTRNASLTQDRIGKDRDRDRLGQDNNYAGEMTTEERLYVDNFGKMPNVAEKSLLSFLLRTHDEELVEYAFIQAVEKDKKNIAYVKGVLNVLDKNNVKDMGDLAEYHMKKGRV